MRKLASALVCIFLLTGCAQHPSDIPEPSEPAQSSQTATQSAAPVLTPSPSPTPTSRKPADCSVEKCIALTFDDGPGPFTEGLLDEFKKRGVHVTFFLVGRSIPGNESTVKRMVDEGHEVANHSYNHPDFVRVGPQATIWQLDETSRLIEQATGKRPTLARPPYGSFNAYTPTQSMSFVLWSVDTLDWQNRDVNIMTQRALDGAYPGGIILMHDIHEPTAKAVPPLVDKLEEQGYRLVTVSELIGDPVPGEVYYGVSKPVEAEQTSNAA